MMTTVGDRGSRVLATNVSLIEPLSWISTRLTFSNLMFVSLFANTL
jgi:hypothetical protein